MTRNPGTKRLPKELREGLRPIRIGLLRDDYHEARAQAHAQRAAEVSRKLEILREFYGIGPGPSCWLELCLAMARERFPGFRVKPTKKPRKWHMGALWILAGEIQRELDAGAKTQELAASRLASREPWKSFLKSGRWKKTNGREAADTLLEQYTHMPQRYRAVGQDAYRAHVIKGTLPKWLEHVASMLESPEFPGE